MPKKIHCADSVAVAPCDDKREPHIHINLFDEKDRVFATVPVSFENARELADEMRELAGDDGRKP